MDTQYVDWFRSTSPYINSNRGKTFVLALRGEVLAHENFATLIEDIVLLQSLGVRLVLCIGADPQIEKNLQAAQLQVNKKGDVLLIDEPSLAIVSATLGNWRARIEAALSKGLVGAQLKAPPSRAVSGNFITAKPLGVIDGQDHLLSGSVRKIDGAGIAAQLEQANIVIAPSLAGSPSGELFSLNVNEVAYAIAAELHADKLILFSADDGIMVDGKLVRELDLQQARQLLDQAADDNGSDEKLTWAIKACEAGVARTQVVSYTNSSALLTELFSRDGSGSLISKDLFETVRRANIEDISSVLELIRPLERDGTLVRRSREKLEDEIQLFSVMERDAGVIACAALYPFKGAAAGELACVATRPEYQNSGRAVKLLEHCVAQARSEGLKTLFVLTTKTAHWFIQNGFVECSKNDLPDERQALYNRQRNSKILSRKI